MDAGGIHHSKRWEARAMILRLARLCGNRQWNRGFTLIELLIVILIVGILAAVATPLYLGYIRDAKTAEAKAVAGALWTAVQSNAIGTCGVASAVQDAFPKAGLTAGGATNPVRWTVIGGANTLTVACADGTYTPSTGNNALFTVSGDPKATDISFIQVQFQYDSTTNPPGQLKCSTDGKTFVAC